MSETLTPFQRDNFKWILKLSDAGLDHFLSLPQSEQDAVWRATEAAIFGPDPQPQTSRGPAPQPREGVGVGEGRHSQLLTFAGRNWRGQDIEDFAAEIAAFDERMHNPPHGEAHCREIARWYVERNKQPIAATATLGAPKADPDNWRPLFHSYDEMENAPPLTFAINGWLQTDGITMYGGLPGHGKTLLGLSTARALLTGEPLFGYDYFKVERAKRVLYLCPEVGRGPLAHRIKLFGLLPFIKSGQLLVRSLSAPEVPLMDARILKAAEGADVFLDTAVRFMEGDENSSSEQRTFAKNLFAILTAGARTVVGLHHSPKFAKTAERP